MKIDRVIISANQTAEYTQYLPLVAREWRKFGFKVEIESIEGRRSDAKMHRYTMATRHPDEFCMLSDADIIPLQREWFAESAVLAEPGKLLSLGSDAFAMHDLDHGLDHGRYPTCYLVAQGRTFRDLLDTTPEYLSPRADMDADDFSDEVCIRHLLDASGIDVVEVPRGWHTGMGRRIDRGSWEIDREKLVDGWYIDAHLPHRELSPAEMADLERDLGLG